MAPASARPRTMLTCWGATTSLSWAVTDWEVLVLMRMVLMPRLRQGLKLSTKAVRLTATSANWFAL